MIPMLLLPVIWGSYYVASQCLVGYTSVFAAGIGIRLITLFCLTGIMWKRHELSLLLQVEGVRKRLLMIGTLGFLLDWTAFIGLSLSSASSGTALLKCDVLIVNIISMIVYKQKFTWKIWICVFVMLLGVFKVMGVEITEFQIDNPGNVFFILSALFVSVNAFVIKSVQLDKKNPICDDAIAFYNNFITLLYFIIASGITGTLKQLRVIGADRGAAVSLAAAALGQTLIYVVYYFNLRNYDVWMVKTVLLLMPLVSSVITFLLFGNQMSLEQCVGMATVLAGAAGILLEQKLKRKQEIQRGGV